MGTRSIVFRRILEISVDADSDVETLSELIDGIGEDLLQSAREAVEVGVKDYDLEMDRLGERLLSVKGMALSWEDPPRSWSFPDGPAARSLAAGQVDEEYTQRRLIP